MDYFISIVSSITDNPDQLRWLLIAAVALVIFTLAMGAMLVVAGVSDPTRRRLASLAGPKAEGPSAGDRLAHSLRRLAPVILPKNPRESSTIQVKLVQAGLRAPSAVMLFYASKTFLALLLPGALILAAPLFPQLTLAHIGYGAILFMAVGVFGPNYVVDKMAAGRRTQIRRSFPEALDMLVVCVEAGLSFDLAFRRVADEMRYTHRALAEELAIINGEVRAGVDRIKALRNFADRSGIDDIKGFVALLAQSVKLGSSIADTLRIYAEEFRDKRIQAAEEEAAKVGTKLIFPLVLCFFPCFFIVSIGPVLIKVFAVFGQ